MHHSGREQNFLATGLLIHRTRPKEATLGKKNCEEKKSFI